MTIESERQLPEFLTVLSVKRLKELLHYDPDTGIFTWNIAVSRNVKVGDQVGKLDKNGYVIIGLSGYYIRAHKLAWLFTYGMWPQEIDHKDRVKWNNAISNLRVATHSQNAANKAAYSRLGIKGVRRMGKRFEAKITVDGISIYLGSFTTIEEAKDAYANAAKEHFGEFAYSEDKGG